MEPSATQSVRKASEESDQFAGLTAPRTSEMTVRSVSSQNHMVEVWEVSKVVTIKRNGVSFGTQNVVKDSMLSLAVYAHQSALRV